MNQRYENFYKAYWYPGIKSVYTDKVPKEMMLSPVDKDGWYEWKLLKGTLTIEDYRKVEDRFGVEFPESFKEWHRQYFFANCDCSILQLPASFPTRPLEEVIDTLDWDIAQALIPEGLISFGSEGNDTGSLVFDARNQVNSKDFPIRVYDHEYGGDLAGLSDVIFSSFDKLIECLTYFLHETKTRRRFDVIPEFFTIDTEGAGNTGMAYWNSWIEMEKTNHELFGN